MHKSSFIQMVLGYIPGSEGYIPLFLQGTIVLGTVVFQCCVNNLHVAHAREWMTMFSLVKIKREKS
jgi:hypothetical protein